PRTGPLCLPELSIRQSCRIPKSTDTDFISEQVICEAEIYDFSRHIRILGNPSALQENLHIHVLTRKDKNHAKRKESSSCGKSKFEVCLVLRNGCRPCASSATNLCTGSIAFSGMGRYVDRRLSEPSYQSVPNGA